MSLLQSFIQLFMESAPWLLLGFFVAGIVKLFVPVELLSKHLGKHSVASVVKAALVGAPLPLCSCGVIPAAMGLRRSGASKSSTTAFLISTPETGIDSIAISYALLGPVLAIVRPIAAVCSAIAAGLMVGPDSEDITDRLSSSASSCCSSKSSCSTAPEPEKTSCCGSQPKQSSKTLSSIKRFLRFTCVELVDDIALWLLLGLVCAAAITAFVPASFLAQWGSGFLAFAVMALIGVPMYICATASTPIAAGLLFSGVSPGAVLVFLLVGPATNIATVAVVKRELGQRALVAYLAGVVGVGFLFGWLVNVAVEQFDWPVAVPVTGHIMESANAFVIAASLLLAALMLASIYRKLTKPKCCG